MSNEEEINNKNKASSGIIFSRVFWAMIFLMLIITVALYIVAFIQGDDTLVQQNQSDPGSDSVSVTSRQNYDMQSTSLRKILSDSLPPTVDALNSGSFIAEGVDALYAPVYASVRRYADIHYTVLGGYSEVWAQTFGDPTKQIEEILFDGFDSRFNALTGNIDNKFNAEYKRNFEAKLRQELPDEVDRSDISSVSESIIKDSFDRIKVSAPVSTIASASGAFGAKVVAQKFSAQFVAALAVKTGGKFVAKSGVSALGGAATAAAGGAVVGPIGAAIGGAVAAIGIWLGVDKLFVEADESLNRESFEAVLIAMIDESKMTTRTQLEAAIKEKADIIEESFTLRELSAL